MKSKKGSLELSINAIVILVLAITLLGLGLTFIRGLFGKATDKLGGFVDAADLENPPTAEEPVGISDKISIKVGETRELKLGYYNNNKWTFTPTSDNIKTANSLKFFVQGCKSGTTGSETTHVPSIKMVQGNVDPSKSAGFKIILSIVSKDLKTKPTTDSTVYNFAEGATPSAVVADTNNPFNTAGTYVCTLRAVGDKNSAASTYTRLYADKSFFLEVVS